MDGMLQFSRRIRFADLDADPASPDVSLAGTPYRVDGMSPIAHQDARMRNGVCPSTGHAPQVAASDIEAATIEIFT